MKENWILGINASHNGSVCILKNEKIFVTIQEERLSRIKRERIYAGYPNRSLEYCFKCAGITPADIDLIIVSVQGSNTSKNQDIRLNKFLKIDYYNTPFYYISHHMGHAIGVYACSGFSKSAILVIDGAGSPFKDLSPEEKASVHENIPNGWESISLYYGIDKSIIPLKKILATDYYIEKKRGMPAFNSLGGLFQAISYQIIGQPMEIGKVMGLASYGKPCIPITEFVRFNNDTIEFTNDVCRRFTHNKRWPWHKKEYADLAASAQKVLEESLLYVVRHFNNRCKTDNLCYSGGVALNCLANELLIRKSGFKEIFIMPPADDSGVAIGAAYWGLWRQFKSELKSKHISVLTRDSMGRSYSKKECADAILRFPYLMYLDRDDIVSTIAKYLITGNIVGWFQGKSELGPRALGQRSILCDPRIKNIKGILNTRVKFREPFRPYAASVLAEEASEWFDFGGFSTHSPFMLRAVPVKLEKKDKIIGVIHVDGTCRIQTVTKEGNGIYYFLIKEFFRLTGVPLILNTSFNIMGDPMIETPEDAVDTFIFTGMDVLALGNIIITKKPGFSSIFDLVPYIKNISLIKSKASNFINAQELIELIKIIDGKRNVQSLLEQFEKHSLISSKDSGLISNFRLVRFLLRLYRFGVTGFIQR